MIRHQKGQSGGWPWGDKQKTTYNTNQGDKKVFCLGLQERQKMPQHQ